MTAAIPRHFACRALGLWVSRAAGFGVFEGFGALGF